MTIGHNAEESKFVQSVHFVQPKDEEDKDDIFSTTPIIPLSVYENLPQILKDSVVSFSTDREKDIFLTGSLSILSGCLKATRGLYDKKEVYPNLFGFIVAPAANGKGALTYAKALAMPFHKECQATVAILNSDMSMNTKLKGLYIPANSSAAAIIMQLDANGGEGVIVETEADTLNNALKQDWGNFSDMLRKAFHHEPITYSRVKHDTIEIDNPKLSIALSGTPNQVTGLIKSGEDGLFSRFMYYVFKSEPIWKDVSTKDGINLTEYFERLSKRTLEIIKHCIANPTQFDLTQNQWERLNQHFTKQLANIMLFVSEDASSAVYRLGLICFRIAMILTTLKKAENKETTNSVLCSDADFNSAILLTDVYLKHSMIMYHSLPKTGNLNFNQREFFEKLGNTFSRQDAVAIGRELSLKERSVDKYLRLLKNTGLLTEGERFGHYKKV